MALAPDTKSGEIFNYINSVILNGEFISEDSDEFKSLAIEARKIMPFDPACGNIALANIYAIANNSAKVIDHLRIAGKLPGSNEINIKFNSLVALANCGLYSNSQKYFNGIKAHEGLSEDDTVASGYSSLSYILMNELLKKYASMFENMSEHLAKNLDFSARAKSILEKNQVTDLVVGEYADVFGTLLSENNLMLKTRWPEVIISDGSNGFYPDILFITFKVGTDDATAAKLYREGTKRLIKKFKHIPDAIHFSVEAI